MLHTLHNLFKGLIEESIPHRCVSVRFYKDVNYFPLFIPKSFEYFVLMMMYM